MTQKLITLLSAIAILFTIANLIILKLWVMKCLGNFETRIFSYVKKITIEYNQRITIEERQKQK